jgi:heat shock protein HtpX
MSPLHQSHKLRNSMHTLILLSGMLLLLLALFTSLFGSEGIVMMLFSFALLLLFTPRASAWLVLRLHRARQLPFASAPELYRIVEQLARHAELSEHPLLFYIPSPTPNAFAMSERGQPLIAVTDGLLEHLDSNEIAAVLAHEISHIRNGDLNVMMAADLISRMTGSLATVGWLMLVINLPLWLLTGTALPWLAILLLLFAPLASTLLQLALSRTREFDADLDAARITGDAGALARALLKLEQVNSRWWNWLIPMRHEAGSSWARTHPSTRERVRRLRALAAEQQAHASGPAGFYPPYRFIAEPVRLPGFGAWR